MTRAEFFKTIIGASAANPAPVTELPTQTEPVCPLCGWVLCHSENHKIVECASRHCLAYGQKFEIINVPKVQVVRVRV